MQEPATLQEPAVQEPERTAAANADPSRLIDPPYDEPAYRSSAKRSPRQPLVVVPSELMDRPGPLFGDRGISPADADLTRQHSGEPIGERIRVSGRVLDAAGRPVTGQLVELWQANAAGRYAHLGDVHAAPLDPNFSGAGRCLTDDDGGWSFLTIKPGAYPWGNHPNAWRPAHLHFSVFGRAFTERLVTQMYFADDPLFDIDPIARGVHDQAARRRMIASFDWGTTQEAWSLGYRFDIVVSGRLATGQSPA